MLFQSLMLVEHRNILTYGRANTEVAQQDLPRLAALMQPYISCPLGWYEDAETSRSGWSPRRL
jgi:hypothetical protein